MKKKLENLKLVFKKGKISCETSDIFNINEPVSFDIGFFLIGTDGTQKNRNRNGRNAKTKIGTGTGGTRNGRNAERKIKIGTGTGGTRNAKNKL